jgi:hypothetical protein
MTTQPEVMTDESSDDLRLRIPSFESTVPEAQAMIASIRREANELVGQGDNRSPHLSAIRRERARVMRIRATKWENWIVWMRGLIAEDEARRVES